MVELIYPELSYKIIGILYKIHTELGQKYQEKYYQRAVEIALKNEKIPFVREIRVDLKFSDQKIGSYFLDFLICDKIVLELKTVDRISKNDIIQVSAYLKSTGKKLGILANFRTHKLSYKRILNLY